MSKLFTRRGGYNSFNCIIDSLQKLVYNQKQYLERVEREIKVYHGSDTIVDSPKIFTSNRPLDFGNGFYVTSSVEQARSWATDSLKYLAYLSAEVLDYER